MARSFYSSKILIRMMLSFVLSYLLFPYLYKMIFNEQPYFFAPVLIFPILYGLFGVIFYKARLKDFVSDLKVGLIVLLPGLVLSFYTPGHIIYLCLFYWMALKAKKAHPKHSNN
ncbi:hypothetical protein R4Z10_18445 [Niallia sp. XMNu-256]|uniref:hypothetical protein n=1 Tax=Niallia sp. XMNu-256 TaxID=3082444 RepID=UPI0030CDFFA3